LLGEQRAVLGCVEQEGEVTEVPAFADERVCGCHVRWPCLVATVLWFEELLFPSRVGDLDGSFELRACGFEGGVQGCD
jgi:hypothetical protein